MPLRLPPARVILILRGLEPPWAANRLLAQTEILVARKTRKKLGEILLARGVSTTEQLESAADTAKATGKKIGESGIAAGAKLFLSLKAGVGGSRV